MDYKTTYRPTILIHFLRLSNPQKLTYNGIAITASTEKNSFYHPISDRVIHVLWGKKVILIFSDEGN